MADDKKEVDLKPGEEKELVIPLAVKGDDKKEVNLKIKIEGKVNKESDNLSKISEAGENIEEPETDKQKDEGTEDLSDDLSSGANAKEESLAKSEPKDEGMGDEKGEKDDKQDGLSERGEMNKRPEMRNKEEQKDGKTKEPEDEGTEEPKTGDKKGEPEKPELGPHGQLRSDRMNKQKELEGEGKDKDEDKKKKFKTIQEWKKFKKQAREKNRKDRASGVKKEATNKAIKLLSFEFYRQCWLHYFSSWTLTYFGLLFLFVLKYLKFEKNIVAFVSLSDPSVREKVVKGEDKTSILAIMAFLGATAVECFIIFIICVFIVIISKALSNPVGALLTAVKLVIELGIKLLGLSS